MQGMVPSWRYPLAHRDGETPAAVFRLAERQNETCVPVVLAYHRLGLSLSIFRVPYSQLDFPWQQAVRS